MSLKHVVASRPTRRTGTSPRSQYHGQRAISRLKSGIEPVLERLREEAMRGSDRAELQFKVLSAIRQIRLSLSESSESSGQ